MVGEPARRDLRGLLQGMRADRACSAARLSSATTVNPTQVRQSPDAVTRLVMRIVSARMPYRSKYRAISVSGSTFVSDAGGPTHTSTVVRVHVAGSAIRRRRRRIANPRRAIVVKYSPRQKPNSPITTAAATPSST